MKPVGNSEYGSGSKSGSTMGKVFESLAAPKFRPRIIGNGLGKHNSVRRFELIIKPSPHPKNGSKKGYGFAGLLISTDPPAPLRYFYEAPAYNLVWLPFPEDHAGVFGNVVVEKCSSEVTLSSSAVVIKDT